MRKFRPEVGRFNSARRRFLAGSAVLGSWVAAALASSRTLAAMPPSAAPEVSGETIALTLDHAHWTVDGRSGHAVMVNGSLPVPLIRLKEGQRARIAVTNRIDETASIHWHGLLVPPPMDGVPGVSLPGIAPGATFTYDFPILQSGT